VSSDAGPDRDATPERLVRRAGLLADLGRYDEAAADLGHAIAIEPANAPALTLLARVHLAAARPDAALAAADASLAADGTELSALSTRAMALIDLGRFPEAAEQAEEILRLGAEDAEALCAGAAALSESRNGQRALDAAWRAVELAPQAAQTHLVLSLVATRLRQFSLAERAYREALELEPGLADAHEDVGVIALEQRRYAQALAELAEAAVAPPPEAKPADRAEPVYQAPPAPPAPPAARTRAPFTGPRASVEGVRSLLNWGAGYAIVVPVFVACAASGNPTIGRVQAVAMAVIGLGILGVLATRLPGRPGTVLRPMMRVDRPLAVAVYAVAAGPFLILLHAFVGSPWPLVAAVGAGFVALLANAMAER
jgi:tetratricopeptide (TPR) repeat protein